MALTRLVNDYKDSVKAASTGANINLAAAPNTIDGVSLSANDRVLVKDQSPTYLNGIYRVTTLGTGANGSWTRSSDFNDWREISPGAMVFVEAGSINGNAFYFINGGGSNVTINTTAINFSNLYSVNGNVTSFPGNVNIAGSLTVTGNIITKSYETISLTEYANSLTVTGNIDVTNSGNINIGAGGNIYMGSTALPRFRTGNTAPTSPNLGDTWYQGNTDILYEYIQDANNNRYWLDLSSNPSSYGNLTVANTLTVTGNLNIDVNSLNVTGGTAGYVLRTDGNGGLSWVAVTASTGGSNTMVQFSDAGSLGGATYIQYNKTSGNLVSNSTTQSTSTSTGALVLAGGLGVGGNIYAANILIGSTTTLTGVQNIGLIAGSRAYLTIMGARLGDTGSQVTGVGALEIQGSSGSGSGIQSKIDFVDKVPGGNTLVNSARISVTNSATATNVGQMVFSTYNGSSLVEAMRIYENGNIITPSTTTITQGTLSAVTVNANAFYSNYYLYSNGSTITTPAGGSNTFIQFNDGTNFAGATYLQYNKTSGNLVSNSATTSTSSTTGALVVSGGIGVGGNINATALYSNSHYYSNGTPIISSIYDLDDLSNYVDGTTNTFALTYNKANVTILSPWQLTVTVNGQLQPAWAYNIESLWQSFVLTGNKGYTVINYYYPNGTVLSGPLIKFADSLQIASQVLVRTVTGSYSQPPKIYPFKPVDILLGAD